MKQFLFPFYGWKWPLEIRNFPAYAVILPSISGVILGITMINVVISILSWPWLIPIYVFCYYVTAVICEIEDRYRSTITMYMIAISEGWHLAPVVYAIFWLVEKYGGIIDLINYVFSQPK